mmetsp:Transcript_33669/g.88187  ORF Transcript_33669/g.88187 Transcript_33669/m.88187 type:complete len:464 (+) Transcript_33669:132-1523(+)
MAASCQAGRVLRSHQGLPLVHRAARGRPAPRTPRAALHQGGERQRGEQGERRGGPRPAGGPWLRAQRPSRGVLHHQLVGAHLLARRGARAEARLVPALALELLAGGPDILLLRLLLARRRLLVRLLAAPGALAARAVALGGAAEVVREHGRSRPARAAGVRGVRRVRAAEAPRLRRRALLRRLLPAVLLLGGLGAAVFDGARHALDVAGHALHQRVRGRLAGVVQPRGGVDVDEMALRGPVLLGRHRLQRGRLRAEHQRLDVARGDAPAALEVDLHLLLRPAPQGQGHGRLFRGLLHRHVAADVYPRPRKEDEQSELGSPLAVLGAGAQHLAKRPAAQVVGAPVLVDEVQEVEHSAAVDHHRRDGRRPALLAAPRRPRRLHAERGRGRPVPLGVGLGEPVGLELAVYLALVAGREEGVWLQVPHQRVLGVQHHVEVRRHQRRGLQLEDLLRQPPAGVGLLHLL